MMNTRESGFCSLNDLVAYMSDSLGLDSDDVRRAIEGRRAAIGRLNDLTGDAYEGLEKFVWDDVTGRAEWPF